MMIIDPITDAINEIRDELTRAQEAERPWATPEGPTISLALNAGQRAASALADVFAALGELEPGPALTVTEAVERALGVRA